MKGGRESLVSDFFILNLSVAEIMFCCFSTLSYLHFFILGELSQQGVLNVADGIAITGRPLFQCLMCVERYLAVIHPTVFLKYKPLRYKLLCSAPAWLVILGSCLMCASVPRTEKSFNFFCTVSFVVWFSVMVFCCLAVLKALKQPGPGEGDRERGGTNNIIKMRAFRIILVILCTSLIYYLPVMMVPLFYLAYHSQMFLDFAILIVALIVVAAGFVQPILYLRRSRQLKCFGAIFTKNPKAKSIS